MGTMRKTKITSFDEEGLRGGRSLDAVLSELDAEGQQHLGGNENDVETGTTAELGIPNETERKEGERVLQICRLSFTSPEKALAMGKLVRSKGGWTKIVLEKVTGRFVSMVLQDSVESARILEVKQHQRYDGIKWNFGLDWFPRGDNGGADASRKFSFLEEIHLTGVRFRSGDELTFLRSLSDGLAARGTTTNDGRRIGLRVLELNACRFLYPDIQYPILFGGLGVACFGTLEKLWMPKSPGLDDDRFEELFGSILHADKDTSCSIRELGFSFNGCGWKGSQAVASFLQAPQSSRLEVLYLNRQQGELDLQGILRAAAASRTTEENFRPRKLHLNLSQNYVSGLETLQELRDLSASHTNESQGHSEATSSTRQSLHVELTAMTFEVPEVVFPGNEKSQRDNSRTSHNNNHNQNGKRGTGKKSFEGHLQQLSKEEIAKLNVACGRVKYVLGRAASASNRNNTAPSQTNPSSVASGKGGSKSDRYFSSLTALECVLPDLLTILRLQEKQNAPQPHESGATNKTLQLQDRRQHRNWLPTFLRKAIKGKIEILKPWLLSASQNGNDGGEDEPTPNNEGLTTDTRRPIVVLSESERDRLENLWKEIEALHENIAHHGGQWRHKHSPGNPSAPNAKSKHSRKKNRGRKGLAGIPMTPRENPLVRAAYEAVPAIPTSILESSSEEDSPPVLSLPREGSHETNPLYALEFNGDSEAGEDDVSTIPPLFVDTAEGLSKVRDDLFRRPPPHKLPRMVAVDSEWYFTENSDCGEGGASGTAHPSQTTPRKKKSKLRSMAVATLQIAYVDENPSPIVLRSFVIDLLSNRPGFQELAKNFVYWLFGSASCDMIVLGFAFGGDLRQLRKYAGIGGSKACHQSNKNSHFGNNNNNPVASLEVVESRCLDLQQLLASPEERRKGLTPGLKKCAELYFQKPLKKDDQTSDWRERPLRPSQLEYAALDAVILLVLLSQKKHEDDSAAASAATATTTSTM